MKRKNNAAKYKNYADLIMANLYNSEDYVKQISLQDWNTQETVKIALDDKLTLKENAQKYYHLYTKSKNAVERLAQLTDESALQAEYFEGILYSIEKADTLSELFEILSECEELNLIKNAREDNKKADISVEQREIHTQNCTGSHVLLKITDNRLPDDKTIYECCKLAKKYSKAADSTKAGVIYTKRKYLRKPPKANLGYVTYKNEQEIIVND